MNTVQKIYDMEDFVNRLEEGLKKVGTIPTHISGVIYLLTDLAFSNDMEYASGELEETLGDLAVEFCSFDLRQEVVFTQILADHIEAGNFENEGETL